MPASLFNDKYSGKQTRKRAYDCSRNHVEEWRDKAAELRVLATTIKNIEIQEKACRLADEYDGLADETEARSGIIRRLR